MMGWNDGWTVVVVADPDCLERTWNVCRSYNRWGGLVWESD